jgi:hypothetical protein
MATSTFPETKSELEQIAEQQKFVVGGGDGAYTVNDVLVGPNLTNVTRIMYLLGVKRMVEMPPLIDSKHPISQSDRSYLLERYQTFLLLNQKPQLVRPAYAAATAGHGPVDLDTE